MAHDIRFCSTSEGVRLAYTVSGAGPPLVVVPSWLSHLELDQQELVGPAFFDALASSSQLVRYDKRGMGLSSRAVGDYSLDAQVNDLHALIEHLGLESVTLFGSSQGGVIVIAYAARHPEKVSRIVLFGAYHYIPDNLKQTLGAAIPLLRTDWVGLGTAPMLEWFVPGASPEVREFFARYQREAATGDDAADILTALADYRVTSLLPQIKAPTLVMHRRDDRVVDISQGREIAGQVPDARFVALEGQVHLPYWGETRPILEAIEEFLRERDDKSGASGLSAFRTVLFTDLVGHTEMMSRLGDERGRAVLREHERITRETLAAHGGTEVKTMGDGFMASFGSVTRAVECAIALQRAISERNSPVGAQQLPASRDASEQPSAVAAPSTPPAPPPPAHPEALRVRVGLNAGEPIEEDGDLFGSTVILASRIAAKAEGGEILVSDNVRSLCSGKGFLFADRGEFVAKGFEEPVRVYDVNWRD